MTVSRVLLTALLLVVLAAAPADAAVTARGPAAFATYASDSTKSISVAAPAGAQPGDVLLAAIGFGATGAKTQPSLTAPPGWTLVTRTNQGSIGALAVYRHVFGAGEASYVWTAGTAIGGTAFVTAFGGVDSTGPVDVSAGRSIGKHSSSIATPSLSTHGPDEMLVASYYGYRGNAAGTVWTPPAGMSDLGQASNSTGSRSGNVDSAVQASAGSTGAKTAKTSPDQDYAVAILTALRPGSASTAQAPSIGSVQAGAVTTTSATITWNTDQASDSQVEYGTTSSYGSATLLDSAQVTSHSQNLAGLRPNTVYHYRVLSRNASGQLAASPDYTFQTSSGGAVPLIVDTDIFSDADDVGALATAFGLQIDGEARVVAIGVNTRTSRPAVATNSWKCAAAVAAFYNSSSVPIGTAMPNNGTAVNDPDFVGPCSKLAPASTPAPESAVTVFRRALAAQPDGSVVMASAGYFGNLAALLQSPPDAISPLSGRDLVAKKVKVLVAMAGGYPQRSGENNLIGDPASAQIVASDWPSKIVWSGYEVGDQIHTGNTISSVHPPNSPVRVSYEAFVPAGNWIYSYDLTAVYHAIRPSDSLLTEVGPGTNTVNDYGGNKFTMGSGNQYYLSLSSASGLDSSIEALLDTLPTSAPAPAPADTTPPVVSGVAASSIDSSHATISWTTDEPASSSVEYGTTSAYGSSTDVDGTLASSHSQTLSGLSPGTVYHYRVRSTDAAGNTAVSQDHTFTTAAASAPSGLNDDFSSNALDPSLWSAAESGSTVAAANQELEITHPAGNWTKGSVTSAGTFDASGRSVQVQVKRAANDGLGGSTYGETSLYLTLDGTHYATFFVAGGALTAWLNTGSGEQNLTPGWPSYSAATMQWLRFRESGGRLYWEYASGTSTPGPWNTLASAPTPFALDSVRFQIVAGSNVNVTDTAIFDNVATY